MRSQAHIPATILWKCSRRRSRLLTGPAAIAAVVLFAAVPGLALQGSEKKERPPTFTYVGGTERFPQNCAGTLQLTPASLTYKCAQHELVIPYSTIETMQYRDDVIRRIRKMKVKWALTPPEHSCRGKNCYFTLLYRLSGGVHVAILDVPPEQMRPYLAEIDLQAGRRVEVQSHENYQP